MSAEQCLTALPQCKLPFHWPRVDFDQLLCVRILDHASCRWSGGFHIDRVDSFHVNMRYGKQTQLCCGDGVAQLVERWARDPKDEGSNHVRSARKKW